MYTRKRPYVVVIELLGMPVMKFPPVDSTTALPAALALMAHMLPRLKLPPAATVSLPPIMSTPLATISPLAEIATSLLLVILVSESGPLALIFIACTALTPTLPKRLLELVAFTLQPLIFTV